MKQSGAVSIFAVIFSALLLTVLTVGFIRLMISGQQQAINNDLSQSAYDSAMAGVEDAKRVVRACQVNSSSEACTELAEAHDCRVVIRSGVVVADSLETNEIMVRSNSGNGEEFDQAYTCVDITMSTPDYVYEATTNQPRLVPLRATDEFDRVTIEWFTRDNASGDATAPEVETGLPELARWRETVPPVIRAQVITPGAGSFSMSDLDENESSRVAFLRPSSVNPGAVGTNWSLDIADRQRQSSIGTDSFPCSARFHNSSIDGTGGYACSVTLVIGSVSRAASRNAFLNLTSIYNGADIRVSLSDGANRVLFDGVQPLVDSTGRANDLFRRVEARLELGNNSSYPSYGVDVAGSLCKDFSVNTEVANPGTCQP